MKYSYGCRYSIISNLKVQMNYLQDKICLVEMQVLEVFLYVSKVETLQILIPN